MTEKNKAVNWLLGLAGAAVGGIVGYYVFRWFYDRNFYAVMIPGAVLGLVGSLLFRSRSLAFGIVCAVLALLLGVFSHWQMRIPNEDEEAGFFYLLMHLNHISSVPLVLIALGGIFGFWFGQGRQPIRSMREE